MKRLLLSLLAGSAIALTGLTGCADSSFSTTEIAESAADAGFSVDAKIAQSLEAPVQNAAGNNELPAKTEPAKTEPAETEPAQRPQLIKKASISLRVDSIEESTKQVREIVDAQQGDVLSLSDRSNSDAKTGGDRSSGLRPQATQFTLRVPQDRFDNAIDALVKIGEVQDRTITTEDVSSQLVDLQARISNSQQSEAALKEIMSRSGEIADVLEVSRELSKVRQEIEQMKAAQQNLQTQVRYSTISLSLESAIAQTPSQPALAAQLANTWTASTRSVGNFTTDLLQIGLWLLVYSPYIAILLGGAAVARKVFHSSASE